MGNWAAFDIEIANEIPKGYCQCGCGGKTNIAPTTSYLGVKKGDPYRYIYGHSGGRKNIVLEQRFWLKVKKSDEYNGCWEWIGCKQSSGYGQIRINGKTLLAHRVSWIVENGNIDDKLLILHKCDNPSCVRPKHLFLGTFKDNTNDMIRKGRNIVFYGERQTGAKLTNNEAKEIRLLYGDGNSSRKLANKYGVSHTTILCIVRGLRYIHIDKE